MRTQYYLIIFHISFCNHFVFSCSFYIYVVHWEKIIPTLNMYSNSELNPVVVDLVHYSFTFAQPHHCTVNHTFLLCLTVGNETKIKNLKTN